LLKPFSRSLPNVEQNLRDPTDSAEASGSFSQRLIPHLIAQITRQLQRFSEKSEGVIHGVVAGTGSTANKKNAALCGLMKDKPWLARPASLQKAS
jgi:hypothetical protein